MNIDDYQNEIEQFACYEEELYPYMAIVEELGELFGIFARYARGDAETGIHHVKVRKEMGDVMWNLCRIATHEGLSMSDILQTNLDKLHDRKKRGVLKGKGDER